MKFTAKIICEINKWIELIYQFYGRLSFFLISCSSHIRRKWSIQTDVWCKQKSCYQLAIPAPLLSEILKWVLHTSCDKDTNSGCSHLLRSTNTDKVENCPLVRSHKKKRQWKQSVCASTMCWSFPPNSQI